MGLRISRFCHTRALKMAGSRRWGKGRMKIEPNVFAKLRTTRTYPPLLPHSRSINSWSTGVCTRPPPLPPAKTANIFTYISLPTAPPRRGGTHTERESMRHRHSRPRFSAIFRTTSHKHTRDGNPPPPPPATKNTPFRASSHLVF